MEQYKTALEHISVRAGTAIPTGAAEGALAALYQRREEAWPFLAEHLIADGIERKEGKLSSKSGTQANGIEGRKGDADGEVERPAAFAPDGAITTTTDRTKQQHEESGVGQHQQRTGRAREKKRRSSTMASGEAISEPFSLARLSVALEAFACACEDRGCPLEGLAVQHLVDFLYLGGQANVSPQYLRARRSILVANCRCGNY